MDKKCTMCKEMLPLASFYRDKYKKDGYKVYCKRCDGSFRRKMDKETRLVIGRIRRESNRKEMNHSYWNLIGRRHNTCPERLKLIYADQQKKCFYCKCQIDHSNLHIDHYYPQKSDKLVFACQDCNRLKWQRDGEEFINFLKSYIKRFS